MYINDDRIIKELTKLQMKEAKMYKLLIILAVISCQKVEMKEVLRPVKTTTIKASDGFENFCFLVFQSPYGSNLSFRLVELLSQFLFRLDVVKKSSYSKTR